MPVQQQTTNSLATGCLTGGRPPLHQVHLVHVFRCLRLHHIEVAGQRQVLLRQLGVAAWCKPWRGAGRIEP